MFCIWARFGTALCDYNSLTVCPLHTLYPRTVQLPRSWHARRIVEKGIQRPTIKRQLVGAKSSVSNFFYLKAKSCRSWKCLQASHRLRTVNMPRQHANKAFHNDFHPEDLC